MKEQGKTKNLGQIAAIWISPNAPENLQLIWYSTSERVHKVYDTSANKWTALNPQIVTNSTISSLRNTALHGGLSLGKFYYLTDVGTLAVAITSTKIWYVDALNNYVVNDLAATITAYINSNNLLIDGSTGIWNNATGKLEFKFSEVTTGTSLQTDNDYIVIRRKNGTAWSWVKAKLSGFVSAVSGNSISWNKGFYFNFSAAISGIKNKSGGVLGYDQYSVEYRDLQHSIDNVSQGNQQILSQAKSYTDDKTSGAALLNTVFNRKWIIYQNPPQVPGNDSKLFDILSILISWTQLLQNSKKIIVGNGFAADGRSGNVNYSDTVRTAIEKLVYKINRLSKFDGIAMNENFDYHGNSNPIVFGDSLDAVLEKSLYQINALKNANNIKLPLNFNPGDYNAILPIANDTLTTALGKLSKKIAQLNSDIWGAEFQDKYWYTTVLVGDKIGEFDSNGKALYSATLEGALYLLGAWYMETMEKRIAQSTYNAYYTSGKGDGRAERNDILKFKTNETGVHILHESTLSFYTYQESNDCLYSYQSDKDNVLIVRDLPKSIYQRIGKTHGYNTPINLNIPITGRSGDGGILAFGTMYAILVQPPQGSSVDAYFKLMPYWTHGVIVGQMIGFEYGDDGNAHATGWENNVDDAVENLSGDFGSYMFWKDGRNQWRVEMFGITIPRFSVVIPC